MRVFEEKTLFIYCTSFFLFFIGCNENKTEPTFWQGEKQVTDQRTVSGTLAIADSVLLFEQFGMPYATALEKNGNELYIKENANDEIFIIGIETLNHIGTISPPEGQGPQELTSFASYDINNENVVINADMTKIQIWNKGGDFIQEFLAEELHPRRVRFRSDGNLVVLSHYLFVNGESNLLHVITPEGKKKFGFGQVSEENYSSLKSEGYIQIDEEDNVYYSSYSEHILKKWDSNGTLLYSVASIDNYPADINYASFEGDTHHVTSYSEFANFHSIGTVLLDDYWLILHGGIPAEPNYIPILDIYNREDGQYLFSKELPYRTGQIVSGNDYLYALHTIEDDVYLVTYDVGQLKD
ncbi:MAG: hypothetical protein WD381_05530 [Balneolaceae bacterium]